MLLGSIHIGFAKRTRGSCALNGDLDGECGFELNDRQDIGQFNRIEYREGFC